MKKLLLVILIGLSAFLYVNRVGIMREVQRVDASSPQSMRSSIEKINRGLTDEEKVVFAKGMMELSAEGMDLPTIMAMTSEDEVRWTMLSKHINGKSVREILAKGRK